MNFNDNNAVVAFYVGLAENDQTSKQMLGFVKDLLAQDLPVESKRGILVEAQQALSKIRKDSATLGTAYNYSSRAKTIFGAMNECSFEPTNGRNVAGVYTDAAKCLKAAGINWDGSPKTAKSEKTAEDEVATAAMTSPLGDVEQTLETVEKHAVHLFETKGADYAIELIAALTALIDAPAKQAA